MQKLIDCNNLGRSYIEANEALASVNILECSHNTFL